MTNKEALLIMKKWLDNGIEGMTDTQLGYIEGWFHPSDREAFELAIEALEQHDSLAYSVNTASELLQKKRPQGEWIFIQGVTCGGYYKCSNCGEVERAEKNFCPNCSARMLNHE